MTTMAAFKRSPARRKGAVVVEYALMAALIAGVAFAGAKTLGPAVASMFRSGAAAFTTAAPGPPALGGGAPGAG